MKILAFIFSAACSEPSEPDQNFTWSRLRPHKNDAVPQHWLPWDLNNSLKIPI
jgi:hypothetical protein